MPLSKTLDNRDTAARIVSEILPEDVRTFAPRLLRRIQNYEDSALIWRHDMQAANGIAGAFDLSRPAGGITGALDNPLGLGPDMTGIVGRGGLMPRTGDGHFDALGRTGRKGLVGVAGAVSGLGRELLGGLLNTAPFTGEVTDDEGQTYNFQGIDRSGPEAIREFFASAAREADETREAINAERPPELQGRLWDNPELLKSSRWWLETLGDGAFSLATQMGAAMLTGGGNVAGGVIGGLQEAEPFYQELVKGGVDKTKARAASAAFGVTVAALNAFSLGKMFGAEGLKNLARRAVGKEIVSGAVEQAGQSALKKIGVGSFAEGFTEWLENPFQAVYETIAKGENLDQGVARVIDSAKDIESFLVGGIIGGAASGIHARAEVRSERGRQEFAGLQDALRRAMDSAVAENARREVTNLAREATMSEDRLAFGQSLEQVAAAADTSATRAANPQIFEEEARYLIPEDARTVWLDVD
ncbi:MAG: hypothetical protein LBB66_01285, partial [Desulfovibrio sp.]|nr:hypothetical protein [Desulfovibrio sp.]